MANFERAGIDVRTEHSVESVAKDGSRFVVRALTPTGEQAFETDLVFHAAGRIPIWISSVLKRGRSSVTNAVASN